MKTTLKLVLAGILIAAFCTATFVIVSTGQLKSLFETNRQPQQGAVSSNPDQGEDYHVDRRIWMAFKEKFGVTDETETENLTYTENDVAELADQLDLTPERVRKFLERQFQ